MKEDFTQFLIDPNRIEGRIQVETRNLMAQMLDFPPVPDPVSLEERQVIANSCVPMATPQVSPVLPSLITLIERILQELETNLPRLLTLNPSRREAIAKHLDLLSGHSQSTQSHLSPNDSISNLRRWIDGSRSASQMTALRAYFEELAIITLGQAIVLKSWSDRGIRKWSESDIGRLNWALSTSLKPHIPMDRESWQITRPNLYSWYTPTPLVQREIWSTLESWKISTEVAQFLSALLGPVRRYQPETYEPTGYDSRFYQCIWETVSEFGFDPAPDTGPLKRNKIVFSPTLRNGTFVRTSPPSLMWIGVESSAFQLMMAELMQIGWGPAAPPYWSIGTGLEVHSRDQLTFAALGASKPSVLARIAEIESCDLAFVLEEQIIRAQGRNSSSIQFREQIEGLPYFKKLRSAGTSLGDLQACVALSKLRPGGLLWWTREEALSSKDGVEVLQFLLEKSKLISEWDLSELEHSLPSATPLYPKYLYLFQKESNLEARLSHRPTRVSIQGHLKSHVEVPLALTESLISVKKQPTTSREHWSILSQLSPTPQREWMDKWPDPTSQTVVRQLNQLRLASLPLASFTTIRHTPESDKNNRWKLQVPQKGFWIMTENSPEGRRLLVKNLPEPHQEAQGSGFLVLVPDEEWIIPLSTYLATDLVQKWLDHHAERRGDRWILNEQIVKWIPVPKSILNYLGVPSARESQYSGQSIAEKLPNEWERLADEILHQPNTVRKELENLPFEGVGQQIHPAFFVRISRVIDSIRFGNDQLFSLVTPDGRVKWRGLIDALPKSECIPITLHPRIRLVGSLPSHLPIGRMDRLKSPHIGILFSTESGFSLQAMSDSALLIHILFDQLEGVSHPTWSELTQYLKLPRKIELAESTALEVLRSHSEQTQRYKELCELLSICQLF